MLMTDIQNRNLGETAWVLGSGASLNFLQPSFFDDKFVVSTNAVAMHFGAKASYAFTHHHREFQNISSAYPHTVFVANRFDYPTSREWTNPGQNVIVHDPKTRENSHDLFDPFERDRPAHVHQLVFGSSSVHGAMHLAAYVGAKNLVLVGVDCGTIDGSVNFDRYPKPTEQPFTIWNRHLILMRDWLVKSYGVNVYSLNPFVNLHLEGHRFDGSHA
jgi:hypothetical protein